MKQTKKHLLKLITLLIVAVLLTVCMAAALVACNGDKNGDNGDGFSIQHDSIDSAALNQALSGMIGYLYANGDNYTLADIYGTYSTIANKTKVVLGLEMSNNNETAYAAKEAAAADDEISCLLIFFESEQNATDEFDEIKEDYDGYVAAKNGKVVVLESKEGVYEAIKSAALPTDNTSKGQISFINKALKNELNGKNARVEFNCYGKLDGFSLYAEPVKGNIYRTYSCLSEESYADSDFKLEDWDTMKSQYTSDSYGKKSESTYYFEAQPKPGFMFVKNEDNTGYVVDAYYYVDAPETMIIPATYNDKPVVEIGYIDIPAETTAITIPDSVTKLQDYIFENAENLNTINFQGTKEQWKELGVELEDITVSCTDDNTDSTTFYISLDSIDCRALDQALVGTLNYLYQHIDGESSSYLSCRIDFNADINTQPLCSVEFGLFNDTVDEAYSLMFFVSEQIANDIHKVFIDDGIFVTQIGSVVIIEPEEGLYNRIKNTMSPQKGISAEQLEFVNSALSTEINADTNHEAVINFVYNPDYSNAYFYLTNLAKKGNISNSYLFCSEDYYNKMQLNDSRLSDFTDDSYVTKSGDTYYIYTQPKAGFFFEETEDGTGYIVENYYYTEGPETLVIPATHNGKPVVEISNINLPDETTAITIPACVTKLHLCFWVENITTIDFKGTKAQWANLNISDYDLKNILVIHCSDGDIFPNED